MSSELNYASVAIVDIDSRGSVAIEAIFVEKDASVLAGALVLESSYEDDIRNILSNKLILVLCREASQFLRQLGFKTFAEVDSFLQDAKRSGESTKQPFASYVTEAPEKESKKVEPSLMNLPEPFHLADSVQVLRSMGKQAYPENTPSDFKRTLAASRMLSLLIEAWLSDEKERVSRKFLNSNLVNVRLLPPSWESEFMLRVSR